ncbi:hypothetical protein [Haloarchaeobius litoreus]|uniref:MYM-type Zinc finger with FCS sequence motif-containing protein n=1 Tax=Haloarchaeobius litoreus TaxID=755306 RepID=A0ABD6DEW0_9EURY|nr:hypothetical protein [Haloarchaeobius litoreus]
MTTPCEYCDSPVEHHDPVYVREGEGEERAFCNYACLTSYVDDEGLTTGNCCRWSPS